MASRVEVILKAIVDGSSSSGIPPAQSRNEALLIQILNKVNELDEKAGKLPIHICGSGEYDAETGMPTVQNPKEDTFYLVPSGEGNNLYDEWVWTNQSWEMFGSAGVEITVDDHLDGQSVNPVQNKVVDAGLFGKLDVDQGVANAGKALVVDENGNVALGEAGIPEAVKVSLLDLVRHVAYIDDQGQAYYDALYMALYGGSGGYPRLEAVYAPGTHVVYTDDALDTLRPYLTVKRRENAQDSGTVVTDYTLSGTLVDGMSTVLVRKDTLVTAVQVEAVDFYNHFEWSWSANGGLLTKTDGGAVVNNSRYNNMNLNASDEMQNARRALVVGRGVSPYKVFQNGSDTGYYPIPIPKTANKVTATIDPSSKYLSGRIATFDSVNNSYSLSEWLATTAGQVSNEFVAGESKFLILGTQSAESGLPAYGDEPNSISVVFEEV